MQAMIRTVLAVLFFLSATYARKPNATPDDIELVDGRKIGGLIVRRNAEFIVIQTDKGEVTVPSKYIRRVDDLPDDGVYFMEITKPGDLPNWRSIVQDLRLDDHVRSFEQIPATAIDIGNLRNVPYLSFRINGGSEMNVYGDPNRPAAIEFGVYGRGKGNIRRQNMVREFIAGHLSSREEIRSLYSLDMTKGGEVRCGKLVFGVTPPEAEDSYGGRWLIIYDPARLAKARVGDAAYAKVTKPFDQVNGKNGRLRENIVQENEDWFTETLRSLTGQTPEVRGFYRDKTGTFRVETFGNGS